MKKLFFLLISVGSFLSLFSQGVSYGKGEYQVVYTSGSYVTNLPKQKTPPKGSVYLVDDWMDATILLRDSSYVAGVKANFNLYSKFIELKLNDEETVLLSFSKIDWFILSDSKTRNIYSSCSNILIDYPELGDCEFVQIIADGKKAKLIDKITLDIIPSNYNTALDAGETSDTYALKHEYYIIKDGKLFVIRKSKSSILLVLNDKKDEVKGYIESNNLKLNTNENLAKVVNYYNSLYEQTSN